MPYTTNKGFSVPATGTLSGTWGSDGTTPTAQSSNALNQGVIQLLDQALAGSTPLSLASSNVTLTQPQTQNGLLRMTGTLSGAIIMSPDSGVLMVGLYSWENLTTGAFTVTLSNGGGSVVLLQGRRGLLWVDVANGPRITATAGSSTADPVPAGSVVPFYNTAVPSGYTVVALNDYALKIVSSSGGVTSGSVAYSTLFGRTATDGHSLITAELAAHGHDIQWFSASSTDASPASYFAGQQGVANIRGTNTASDHTATASVQTTGAGNAHTHNIDMRVNTAAFVLGTRN